MKQFLDILIELSETGCALTKYCNISIKANPTFIPTSKRPNFVNYCNITLRNDAQELMSSLGRIRMECDGKNIRH